MAVDHGSRSPDGQSIRSEAEARKELTEAEIWLKKIALQRDLEQDWRTEAQDAIDVYEAAEDDIAFNIFHSNVETLTPALYNSTPVPDVRRRFGDADPVAKMVVDISERAASFSIDQFDFDAEIKAVIKDGEVAGRGALKFRYKPTWNDAKDKLINQACECERVVWNRIIIGPSTNYAKLPWIAEEMRLTYDELKGLVDKGVKVDDIPLDCDETDDGNATADRHKDTSRETGVIKAARVYQIWDRRKGQVVYVAEGYKDKPIKKLKDPLSLPDFYPYDFYQPIMRLSSTTPVNPYKVYKKLLAELDKVTNRINKLIGQLRVRGLIDKELHADLEKLQTAEDGEYVAAGSSGAFLDKPTGLEAAIAHFPLDPTVKALQQLYIQREQLVQRIYEVTGISDILRGASNAQETLGAQQIKTQWGSLRIQNRQEMVAKLPRTHFRNCIAVFGQHYTPQQISLMTGLPEKNDPQKAQEQEALFMQALDVMRSPEMLAYKVDIETNSTIKADMARVQEQLTQFMMMTGQFMKGIEGFAMQMPMAIPLFLEVYTAVARNFKLGKQAEDALDRSAVMLPQMLQQMQQQGQQEDPKVKQARELHEIDKEASILKHQQELQKAEQDVQHQERLHDLEMRMKMVEAEQAELNATLDAEGKERELEHKDRANVIDFASKRASASQELQHKEQTHGQASRHAEGTASQKARHTEGEAQQKRKHAEAETRQDLVHADAEATQGLVHKEQENKQAVAAKGAEAAIKTASAAASADIKERGQVADEKHAEKQRAIEAKTAGAKAPAKKGKKRTKDIRLKKDANGDIIGALIRDSEGDEVEIRIA